MSQQQNNGESPLDSQEFYNRQSLDSEQEQIFQSYKTEIQGTQGESKVRMREASTENNTPNKKLKISEGSCSPNEAEKLKNEAKFVYEQMTQFQEGMKNQKFPDKIYIIESQWFAKWKKQVVYSQFEPKKQNQASSFFGNWNKPTSNLFKGSLGDKILEEQEFNKKREANNQIQETQEEVEVYTTDHLNNLIELGPIKNGGLLRDFGQFIHDTDSTILDSNNLHNFPLISNFQLDLHGDVVPQEVMDYLAERYTVDVLIPRDKNAMAELQSQFGWISKEIKDRYVMQYEEVRVVLMLPHPEELGTKIKVVQINGEEKKGSIPPVPSFAGNVLPPVPQFGGVIPQPQEIPNSSVAIPMPPPVPSAIPVPPPVPGAAIRLPPPVPGAALPPPSVSSSIPLPPPLPLPLAKFPFNLQSASIYVQKSHQIKDFKQRLCNFLKISPENARIWRFENTSWQNQPENQVKNLVSQLEKMEYGQEVIFPGINIDVIAEKRVFESKVKLGGRICSDKEIIFLEQKCPEFLFKYSPNQKDYIQCKFTGCNKVGLYNKVPCICEKIHYCSKVCQEKDLAHQNSCEEYKKRLYDPQYINFEVDSNPRNGIHGLQNMGNTCYMNSALQCLSHTEPLMLYFCKLMLFKSDLNPGNKLASKNNEIAILFAKFLHTMWNEPRSSQSSFNPILLKRAIGMKNDMFKGNAQHDSNELLQFLLDQVHEDLNRVKEKPKLKQVQDEEMQGLTEEQLVSLQNDMHLKVNQSVIQDLFFGQYKSSVQCLNCMSTSKQIQQFMTMYVQIPPTNFDLNFYFVPYQPNEKIFKYSLKNLSLVMNKLHHVKNKICEVVKQFYYRNTHFNHKTKKEIRYTLSSHSSSPLVEIYPQDLVIASVNISMSKFKFLKLYSEHKGHTLTDIANFESLNAGTSHIFVYQLDPNAIDIEKVSANPKIQFPHFLREDYLLVPIELGLFNKEQNDQLGQTEPRITNEPPRLVLIKQSWSLSVVHARIMSLFCQFVPNNNAVAPQIHEGNPHANKGPCRRKNKLKGYYQQDEYEFNHNLSDDENMYSKQDDDFDFNQIQEEHSQAPIIYQPKPNYTFHQLFQYLLQFRKMNSGENPNIHDLDCFSGGEMVQPISLNIVSKRKIWHQTLKEIECMKLYSSFLDKSKFLECNDFIFEEINPELKEKQGKDDILKFQAIFNINQMPENVSENEMGQRMQGFEFYSQQFVFDSFQRILSVQEPNQIYSEHEPKIKLDLLDCLQKSNKAEILEGKDAYACSKCKSLQKATKKHEIHSVPPILIICLQRFKNGVKNTEKIDFPLEGLDMTNYVKNGAIYDLYGVVNHSGTLNFGHYTAQCFNQAHQKWFNFNDSFVSEVSPSDLRDDIVTPRAYVLFYQRRGFKIQKPEQFEEIKIKETHLADHLIQVEGEEAQQIQQDQAMVVDHLENAQDIDLDDIQQIAVIEQQNDSTQAPSPKSESEEQSSEERMQED